MAESAHRSRTAPGQPWESPPGSSSWHRPTTPGPPGRPSASASSRSAVTTTAAFASWRCGDREVELAHESLLPDSLMPERESILEQAPALVAARNNIDDVLLTLRQLDEALGPADGVRWFNVVYRMVTEAVASDLRAGLWQEPGWLGSLVVSFSGLYFDALVAADQSPGLAPHAWAPLFEDRSAPDIARVQFAVAGFNAHINRDLPRALYQNAEGGGYPAR